MANGDDVPGSRSELTEAIVAARGQGDAERKRILKAARLQKRLNTGLLLAGIVFAAAAGFTVLPESISRVVGAILAFSAAVVTGVNTAFNPARQARRNFLLANQWARWMDDAEFLLRRQSLWLRTKRSASFTGCSNAATR